jgi:hypothetical protein
VFGLSGILTASDYRFSHLACLMCSRHMEMGHPVRLMWPLHRNRGVVLGAVCPLIWDSFCHSVGQPPYSVNPSYPEWPSKALDFPRTLAYPFQYCHTYLILVPGWSGIVLVGITIHLELELMGLFKGLVGLTGDCSRPLYQLYDNRSLRCQWIVQGCLYVAI